MFRMNRIDWVALFVVILCGLDLGIGGLFNFNLVTALFKPQSFITHLLYALTAIASFYMVYTVLKKMQKKEK